MKPVYQIKEYGSFIADREIPGYTTLPEHTFRQLEEFILANHSKDTDAVELMNLSVKKGIGKVITAKNYVGLITLKDQTTIEVLPKIYSAVKDNANGQRTKALLIEMLKTLPESPFKSLQTSGMDIAKLNILEIFIRMFLDEMFFIVKRGLKCSYETVEENAAFFKGKMNFSRQIRQNHIHRERCYVAYDAFTPNRPENRLLKATLLYLYKVSTSSGNRNNIKILLNAFTEVTASTDYKKNFARYIPDRNTKDYSTALLWSRVFLMGKSFTAFSGSEVALALLFPMETLYESYIAALLKKKLYGKDFTVLIQDKSYHLFDEPKRKFLLKPDIVVRRKADGAVFILDTKWKLLDSSRRNYGISQADMYQMYAYQKKYGAKNVTLLYPKTEKVMPSASIRFQSKDGVAVRVQFIDLFDVQRSLEDIMKLYRYSA